MAISLSGGGYRATTFHLGALCLLDAIQLEAGNKLIGDERRRESGATLLENVRIISTISGGTLTGIMYALKLSQKGNFKDCYYSLYDLLKDDKLVDHALDKLNSPGTWKNKYKNRNLINSFAEVYNEHFYGGATFGDLYKDSDGHLTDAIFGASEFTAGLQYRFLQSESGEFGGGDLELPKEVAEKIRLADAAASSSCFPGGFEPMTMPTDFSNGPESRVEEWWRKKKINYEREATLATIQADKVVAAMVEEGTQDAGLSTSISETFNAFTVATKEAKVAAIKEKKAVKAHAKASKTLGDGGVAEQEVAQNKVDKALAKVVQAQAAKEAANKAVQHAEVAKVEVLRQHPKLTALLLTAHEANLSAEAALADATKAVSSAEKSGKRASKKAQEDRKAAESAQATVKNAHDLDAALKRAEKAATLAEKSAEDAIKKATVLVEASADLALILAEKAVELTRRTQRTATAALSAKNKASLLDKAFHLASQAQKVAKDSVDAAKAAEAAVISAAYQRESCTDVVSLAEDTSIQVASYKVNNPEAAAYGESKENGAKTRNMAVKARSQTVYEKWSKDNLFKGYSNSKDSGLSSLDETRDATEGPTGAATYEAAGDVMGTGMPEAKTGTANTLERDASPATQAYKMAKKTEEQATLARKKAAVNAAETVALATEATVVKVQKAADALVRNSSEFPKVLAHAVSVSTTATAEAQKAEEQAVLARREKPYHPTTAIMDGGILDNQGIKGVVMAEDRHTKDGKKPPFIGTYIISDVSGKTMAPYTFPHFPRSAFANFFTLKKINSATGVLMAALLILLCFINLPVWGVIMASVFLTILSLWLVAYLGMRSFFRAKVASTFAGEDLPEIMKDLKILINTPLSTVLHLIVFRATSAMKMITDIFLRQIRRLQLKGLHKSLSWNYRIVRNDIYELQGGDQLTPELKKVVNAANNMPTTLWFSQNEKKDGALDDLIACGQLTLCNNLANYLRDLKRGRNKKVVWDEVEDYHQEIDAVLEILEHYWQNFRLDPYWMIRLYKEEQTEHEEQRKHELTQ